MTFEDRILKLERGLRDARRRIKVLEKRLIIIPDDRRVPDIPAKRYKLIRE